MTADADTVDADAWYVLDASRPAVVAGPYDNKGDAVQIAAAKYGPSHAVVDGERVLELDQGDQTLVWETDDVIVVTDGGRTVTEDDSRLRDVARRLRNQLTRRGESTRPDPSAGVDVDTLLEELSSPRRRQVIRELADTHKPHDIGELTWAVATDEYDVDRDALRSQQRKRVYVSLYQNHLPRLDEASLIDYHDDVGAVEATAGTELAAAVLRDVDERVGGGSA